MVTLGVVLPLGPRSDLDFVADTLDSVRRHTTSSRTVVVVDDSGRQRLGDEVAARHPDVVVLPPRRRPSGMWGGLLTVEARGFARLLDDRPDVVLKLDTDALVVGPEPERDALDFFGREPEVGLLGSYRVTCTGGTRSFAWAAGLLAGETSALGGRRHPRLRRALLGLRAAADAHGYEPGEHCLGGAYFLRGGCLARMQRQGWLTDRVFAASRLGEDHLLGLLVRAAGYDIADFAPDPHPMGLALLGLPMPPAELLARNKKVVHSVRDHEGVREADVRAAFRRTGRPEPGGALPLPVGQPAREA